MKALCLDLGLIKVSNHFSDLIVSERNAVIDEMKLELSDFKLFHADIALAGEQGESDGKSWSGFLIRRHLELNLSLLLEIILKPAANHILVPTSFTLNILRNLSSGWFKDRPDLEVSGKINAINVRPTDAHGIKSLSQLMPAISSL